ncbi:MAG: iron-containing alcohol dehydrogenase [Planctomycetota bacterium]|jgi:alcohol dehydrogenase
MNRFFCPTRVCIEAGSSAFLAEIVDGLHCSSLLMVTDPGIVESGIIERVCAPLQKRGLGVEIFAEVEANPRVETADTLAELLRDGDMDAVVAVGGGSSLDAGKAAAMLARNQGGALSWVGKRDFDAEPLPFIAIPTTCGTGSEVTWVSVLSHPATGRKVSVKGDRMFPAWALVDPNLVASLPASLVASTGMDALTHAMEATTVSLHNPVSDALAEQAIGLILRYLPRAHRDMSGDAEAREGVMRAATIAGLAFGSSDVGAVHCLSETLGGLYDVAHGEANAMLLAPVMRSHGETVARRLQELDSLLPEPVEGGILACVERMVEDLGIPAFDSLDLDPAQLPRVAQGAAANGSNASNPRVMGEFEYLQILEGLSG